MIKKVLCIVNNMDAGGAETFLMKVFRKLDKTKFSFDFCVFSKNKGLYEDEIKRLGGKIYHCTSKTESFKKYKRELFNVIKENDYKTVFRITANSLGLYDLKIAKKAGATKLICRSSNSSDSSVILRILNSVFKRFMKKYATIKIAPSKVAANYTFGTTKNVFIIKNGIDISQYCFSEGLRMKIRDELKLDKNTILIGHVGRFEKQKNHKFLLKIFKLTLKNNKEYKLILIGEGKLKKDISLLAKKMDIKDKIIFAGVQKDMQAYYSSIDLFLFPSLYEGMPNSLIEAQANGLKCFVSDRITQEANVSNDLTFLSLKSAKIWAESIEKKLNLEHVDNREKLTNAGYEINSVLDNVANIIFGD